MEDAVVSTRASQSLELSVGLDYLVPLTNSLQKAGYDWAALREIIGSPNTNTERVFFSEYVAAVEILVNAYGDETGKLSTRPLLPGTSAFIFASIKDCKTLGEAMRKIAEAYNIAHGGYYNRVELSEDYLIYSIDDEGFPFAPDQDENYIFLVMEGILKFVHLCFQNITQTSAGSIDGHLLKVYSKRLGRVPGGDFLAGWSVPVRLGSARYALIYDRRAQNIKLDPSSARVGASFDFYNRTVALMESDKPLADSGSTISARVRIAIEKGNLDQVTVARSIGVSVPTLRRRLQVAGARFRDIRSSVLYAKACDQIERGQNLDAIAEALGFADVRSFNRAFKSWSGSTPVQHAKRSVRNIQEVSSK